jgi:hypothetical protein
MSTARVCRTGPHLLLWLLLCFGLAHAQDPAATRATRTQRFLSGRTLQGNASAARALDAARQQHQAMLSLPRSSILTTAWTAVGPAQVASRQFGAVTGRVTAIAVDPADATGNTVYVGTTGGGVWKSTNAAGPATAVQFVPLTDALPVYNTAGSALAPSLSVGSLALANGVLLAGTGDPNDATDSYYGAGILRSADGGATWSLAQESLDGVSGDHAFFGLSVAGLAFSSLTPSLAVAALSQAAEGTIVDAAAGSTMGLYWSGDAGLTWHMATILDGSQTVQSAETVGTSAGVAATAVVWNPVRQSFYAAIRYHGYYTSGDGQTWTRLPQQPGTGLTTTNCPVTAATGGACAIFRGALAVQAATGDLFALTTDSANRDQGLYQDVCAFNGTACRSAAATFGTVLKATPLEAGSGSTVIAQADYNLTLAATPSGTDTILYAGTTDLYRCSLAAGCSLRNTTNAENGCANPAMVAPSQHAIATVSTTAGPLVYIGNDGGLWRSTDGVNEQAAPCSADDATHFQNLNGGLGSLAGVVSFAQDPADSTTLLAGLGALGTAATSTVPHSWAQLATGEGGIVAIDQTSPLLWYLSTGADVNIARCAKGAACTASDFTPTIGAAQISSDMAALHAPWLLDSGLDGNLIAGTCRVWRGPATGGAAWSASNVLSRPFSTPAATTCSSTSSVVRSMAAGGPVATASNVQNSGSEVIYAGMAGALDGASTLGGHLFVTTAANLANTGTVWTDAALSPVTNDTADAKVFNPGGFDVSSIAVDPHDATGATVYATIMGFHGTATGSPQVYRSADGGAHWTTISANLPNAPANSVIVDPNDANTVYVATDTGVYVTTQVTTCSTTDCWNIYGTALPNAPVIQLAAAAAMPTGDGRLGELRAATYGRGIWQIPLLTAIAPAAPAMTISPTTVTYPGEQVGTASPYTTVTVTNTGNAPLTVSNVTTTGDFNETDTCTGASVAQNATCTVQVRFLPTATGARNGLLTVYGNTAGGQVTATLSGIGLAPATVVLSPATLSFPATNVGGTSIAQTIAVANIGGVSVSLQTPVLSGDFTLSGNTCGNALGAGSSCALSVEFTPAAAGARSGTVTGANPATDTLSPLTLVFAPQQLNTTSASQAATLANAGDVALTLISAQIASGDFSVVNGCGNSLSAHASCSISVTYSPKSVGPETGVLTVTDEFRSRAVQLSGTGLAPPGVSLSPPGGLTFGSVGVGLGSAAQAVTLTNSGSVALVLSSVAVTGDFSLLPGSNPCGATLAPGAACTIQIVFVPTAAGARTGTVTFSDNALNSPQSLALSGTGIDFALASNGPSSITIASGQTATYALLLTSAAGLTGSAALTCSGVPAHSLCTVSPASGALGGSTSVTVTVATGLSYVELRPPPLPWDRPLVWLAITIPLGIACSRRRWRRLALACSLLALSACSASRTIPSTATPAQTSSVTPSGAYTLVVAGSSAGLSRSVNLTLVVQ